MELTGPGERAQDTGQPERNGNGATEAGHANIPSVLHIMSAPQIVIVLFVICHFIPHSVSGRVCGRVSDPFMDVECQPLRRGIVGQSLINHLDESQVTDDRFAIR